MLNPESPRHNSERKAIGPSAPRHLAVNALVKSEMGEHTPGINCDAFYCAEYWEVGKPVALICDGVTSSGNAAALATGGWVASRLAKALGAQLDIASPNIQQAQEILKTIEASQDSTYLTHWLLRRFDSDAVDRSRDEMLGEQGLTPYHLVEFPGKSRTQGLNDAQRAFLSRYSFQGTYNLERLEFDAIQLAILKSPEHALTDLLSTPSARLAISVLNTLQTISPAFHQEYQRLAPLHSHTTLIGAIDLGADLFLFGYGDSQACIVTPNGIRKESLTDIHQDEKGRLTSYLGIEIRERGTFSHLPDRLSRVIIPKRDIPKNSFLVLWSDGYYISPLMTSFNDSLSGRLLTSSSILDKMEATRNRFATYAERSLPSFSVDDRTSVIIPLDAVAGNSAAH